MVPYRRVTSTFLPQVQKSDLIVRWLASSSGFWVLSTAGAQRVVDIVGFVGKRTSSKHTALQSHTASVRTLTGDVAWRRLIDSGLQSLNQSGCRTQCEFMCCKKKEKEKACKIAKKEKENLRNSERWAAIYIDGQWYILHTLPMKTLHLPDTYWRKTF